MGNTNTAPGQGSSSGNGSSSRSVVLASDTPDLGRYGNGGGAGYLGQVDSFGPTGA